MNRVVSLSFGAVVALAAAGAMAQEVVVFSTDFESGMPGQITGAGGIEGVQGFAGRGNLGNEFSGNLLRNAAVNSATVVTLADLPTHEAISLDFLLAVMDSWDSTNGSPAPDYFTVRLDGVQVFQATFAIASGNVNYQAPPGGQIYSGSNLGWNGSWGEKGYDMTVESALHSIAHTSSTATVEFVGNGGGYQGGTDESWGIDNLSISVTIPAPGVLPAMAGLGLIGLRRRR